MNSTTIRPTKVEPESIHSTQMKAIVSTGYGDPEVLQLQLVDKPRPKENEVLVKIQSAAITTAETMMRTGYPLIGRLSWGLQNPKTPFQELALQVSWKLLEQKYLSLP